MSKIHLAVDSFGLPVSFKITGGQTHDDSEAPNLIDPLPAPTVLIAHKGYDSAAIRQQMVNKGAIPNILKKKNSLDYDSLWAFYFQRC
ncbi:MAG: transposase [Candidatus Symbiodolus clandestinus]